MLAGRRTATPSAANLLNHRTQQMHVAVSAVRVRSNALAGEVIEHRATVSRVVETRLAMSLCIGMGSITAALRIVLWLCACRRSSAWTRLWAARVDRSMMRSLALRTISRDVASHSAPPADSRREW